MRSIRLVNVCKSFGKEKVLDNYNLEVPAGNFFALLGPSGCGKTTILRLIAGFETVDSGKIFLGDQDITDLPANERSINTVFQNYALFPHLNVFNNVAYSLRIRNQPQDLIDQKVMKALCAVHLEKQAYRRIDQLSGGQQQRVALARATINEPDVLLLDEPLAALDLKLRERMLVELIELQENLKTTFIYITHDQDEALAVADQMAIMNHDGKIEQIGEPSIIYDQPKTVFVARFVGTTNILEGVLQQGDDVFSTQLEGMDTPMIVDQKTVDAGLLSKKLRFSLRPEKIALSVKEGSLVDYNNSATGEVVSVIYHGKSTLYRVQIGEDLILQVFDQNCSKNDINEAEVDDTVYIHWRSMDVVLLED
jgi:spermidine/putrescine transport system ATP-binding protein